MEDLRSDLLKGSKGVFEDDEVYEKIEAPKFVDFTAPDPPPRPSDSSWFCVRIGCDQQHEAVDPDALFASFKLRVLAARSPNLRFQKVINQRDARSFSKCPHSAPPKSVKDRSPRLAITTTVPEKRIKLKNHPISSLRSPMINRAKVKAQPLATDKALTTPRYKKASTNQDTFRSVRYQKPPPIGGPKKREVVAKVLDFFDTPKKASKSTIKSTPVSEVCAEMRKLKISSAKKTAPRGLLSGSTRFETRDQTKTPLSKKKFGDTVKAASKNLNKEDGHLNDCSNKKASILRTTTANVAEQPSSSTGSILKDSVQSQMVPSLDSDNLDTHRSGIVERSTCYDDNKENVPDNHQTRSSSGCVSLQIENSENLPPKAINHPSKTIQEKLGQGGKHKRTTNPKPFRLRTDERGVLREANIERKLQLQVQKGAGSILRHGNIMQPKLNQIGIDKRVQKAHPIGTNIARSGVEKFAGANSRENSKEKKALTEKSSKQMAKKPLSVIPVKKVQGSQLQRSKNNTASTVCLQAKKAVMNTKEPNSSRVVRRG